MDKRKRGRRSRSRSRERDTQQAEPVEHFDYESLLSTEPQPPSLAHSNPFGLHRSSRSGGGGKTLDQRLEGLREHFLPGGVLGGMLPRPEESQVVSIVAEDGTEGSCHRVMDLDLDRRVGRVMGKGSLMHPARPYVSYLVGGDMRLVADPVLKKGGVRVWRVNGMITGDELKSLLIAEDPRPQRGMLDKLQLASVSEASRKKVLPVAFVKDANSVELPAPLKILPDKAAELAEMFPEQVNVCALFVTPLDHLASPSATLPDRYRCPQQRTFQLQDDFDAVLNYRVDEDKPAAGAAAAAPSTYLEEGAAQEGNGAVDADEGSDMELDDDDAGANSNANNPLTGVAGGKERLGAGPLRAELEGGGDRAVNEDDLEIPTIAVKGVSQSAVTSETLEKHFQAHNPTNVFYNGKSWLVEFASLDVRDRALRDLGRARIGFHSVTLSAFRGNMRPMGVVNARQRLGDVEAEARRVLRSKLVTAVRQKMVTDRFYPLVEEAIKEWEQRCKDREKRVGADTAPTTLGSTAAPSAALLGPVAGPPMMALLTPIKPEPGVASVLLPKKEPGVGNDGIDLFSASFKRKEEPPPPPPAPAISQQENEGEIYARFQEQRVKEEKAKSAKKKAKSAAQPEDLASTLANAPHLLDQYNAHLYRRKPWLPNEEDPADSWEGKDSSEDSDDERLRQQVAELQLQRKQQMQAQVYSAAYSVRTVQQLSEAALSESCVLDAMEP
jgi:hypothetical protein